MSHSGGEKSEVRARMQAIARDVKSELPPGYGFFVLCFPFNAAGRVEYVSNGNRADVVQAMKEFIERNPMQEPEKN
jgi:hypothetical protein